jgi:SAM-dependent methyltransferase
VGGADPVGQFAGAGDSRPYQGAAWHYAEYRPAISDDFARMLVTALGWTSQDRLVDLGAGPGQIAIRLAPYVQEVVAVDPEPDMLSEGERRAAEAGVDNVRFVEGSSDDLSVLGTAQHQFTAVTIGSAFHWMHDQDRVLRDLDRYLHATDAAVLAVGYDVGGAVVAQTGQDVRPWRDRPPWSIVSELIDRYLAEVPEGPHPRGRHDPFMEIFGRSAFPRLRFLRYEYEVADYPSPQAALGYHYSVSHVLARLGDRRAELESEVAQRLAHVDRSAVQARVVDSALIALRPNVP